MPAKESTAPNGAAPRLKLVIRHLPPTLPEELFWKSTEPWINDSTCHWRRYVKGRKGDGQDRRAVYSRAYVLMADIDGLLAFHKGFNGHVYKAKTGEEYQAIVEFAPVQKTPYKVKVKTDARQGTIDDDPDYQSFLRSLEAPATKPVQEHHPTPMPTTTPLLDHLRAHGRSGKGKGSSSKDKSKQNEKSAPSTSSKKAKNRDDKTKQGDVAILSKTAQKSAAEGSSEKAESSTANQSKKSGQRKKKPKKEAQSASQVVPTKVLERPDTVPAPAPTTRKEPPGEVPAGPDSEASRGGARGRGRNRGGRGRGGKETGDRTGDGKERSPHSTVKQILSRNAEGEKKGKDGKGKAPKEPKAVSEAKSKAQAPKGPPTGAPATKSKASQARIDD